MNAIHSESDAGPVEDSTGERPWRLRRPVLAGFALYGTLALVLATIGWFWAAEREKGRQDALLIRVHGLSGFFQLDPDRSIRILEEEVLAQAPNEDTRRRALLVLASTFDSARRYDEADRTYATVRREWPTGLASGPLVVPWANMLVNAGKAARARELLAPAGSADGYGTAEEVDGVRARVARAIESPPLAPAGDVAK